MGRQLSGNRRPLVIYHGGCRDGFAAAVVAWLHFNHGDADFHAGYYGQDPPERAYEGGHVFLLDFSYPREKLLGIAVHSVIHVLDHHQTAQKDLDGLVNEIGCMGVSSEQSDEVIFDMQRSGAGIAWDYFFEGQGPRIWWVDYVEDRDLWRWKLDRSREVNAYIASVPFEFERWRDMGSLIKAREIGGYLLAKTEQYAREAGKNAMIVDIFGCAEVPVVNAPQVDISELLEHLMDKYESFIAVGWWQRSDGVFQYSLRSRGELDVSEIAKARGGGGHKHAAGFQSDRLLHLPARAIPAKEGVDQ